MPKNINVILGSSGSCCSCSTEPPCSDCDKEPPPPPPPPCDCKACGYWNAPSSCEEYANELTEGCGKCVSLGPCNQVCAPGSSGTFGCYVPVLKDCFDLGCVPCTKEYEPSDPCYKLDATVDACKCGEFLSCCTYTNKSCADFNINYFSDTATATVFCGGLNCYKTATVACDSLICYECKVCEDFGYSSTKISCLPGEILTQVTPCGDKLTCYQCVPDTCKCSDYGYYDTCKEAKDSLGNCGECETVTPFPAGSPCALKVCYNAYCLQCGDIGENRCDDVNKTCPGAPCYKVNVVEDWKDCDPPCDLTEPCCVCDFASCSSLAPCNEIVYVNNPNDCVNPLVGQLITTPCNDVWKEEPGAPECYKCCSNACPLNGNFCGILTAPGCAATQKPGGTTETYFYNFPVGLSPLCNNVTIKISYVFGFTPDKCDVYALVACKAPQYIGTTGCKGNFFGPGQGTGSVTLTLPADSIQVFTECTYNCNNLDGNNDGILNTSSIDGFTISCIP